ncbi:MAG: carboxypeptidase regulatory-like domain-containing protein [Planctomycetes bacterium]|nr:carboxypeptidase regulatory-like domain-containing protein [Planctomycetota bacterium]
MDTAPASVLLALLLLVASCAQPTSGSGDGDRATGVDVTARAASAAATTGSARGGAAPDGLPSRDEASLVRLQRVSGRVVDALGAPIAGARVQPVPDDALLARRGLGVLSGGDSATDSSRSFWRDDALPSTATDRGGRFALDVEACEVGRSGVLAISAPGCATRCVDPAPRELGDLVLQPGRSVSGRLVDRSGAPLAGVRLELGVGEGGFPLAEDADASLAAFALPDVVRTRSDVDGRFILDGLPVIAGLVLRLRGLVVDATIGPFDLLARTSRRVPRLDLGDVVVDGRARAAPITGVVLDPEGRPVVGARVLLADVARAARVDAGATTARGAAALAGSDTDPALAAWEALVGEPDVERTLSDARGAFAFVAAGAGARVLLVEADGLLPARRDVPADADAPLRVALEPPGDLVLQLVDAGGAAVDARVLAAYAHAGTPAGPWMSARSCEIVAGDSPGRCFVRGAGRGATRVVVEADGFPRQALDAPGVEPHRVREATLVLDDGARLDGRVVDPSGAPIAGARVVATRESSPGWDALARLAGPAPVATDADGRYALRVLPGAYRLRASSAGRASEGWRVERVVAGERRTLGLCALAPTGTLRVTVRDLRGVPRAGAALTLGGVLAPGATTDADGVATFLDLAEGAYEVSELGPRASTACRVVAGTTTEIELTTPVHLRFAGRVLRHGKPLRGARVRVAEGVTPLAARGGRPVDLDGRFEFTVSSPSVTVLAEAPDGHRSPQRDLWIVRDGEAAFGDVELVVD